MNPFTTPGAWDVLVVNGIPSPGVCTIEGATRKDDLDIKQAKGSDGATITNKGRKVGPFKSKHLVFTAADYDRLVTWLAMIENDPKLPLKGRKVEHPELAICKIDFAVAEDVPPPKKIAPGLWGCDVSWNQFKSPSKSSVTKTASGTTTSKSKEATPPAKTALQLENERLLLVAQSI